MKIKATISEKLARYSIRENDTGCLLFVGAKTAYGYGSIDVKGKAVSAHRASWIESNGEIPEGKVIRHKCKNRNCIEPTHLEIGTQKQNIHDMWRDGTIAKGERNGKSKLTESIVISIRSSSLSLNRLSRMLNIARSTIQCVRKRRTWKHVA